MKYTPEKFTAEKNVMDRRLKKTRTLAAVALQRRQRAAGCYQFRSRQASARRRAGVDSAD